MEGILISRIWRQIEGFDLDYRPRSYFWPLGLREHLMATVKGGLRREMLAAIDEGSAADSRVIEILARASLPDHLRKAMGRIHPMCMGGEYLPDLHENEVEIARITVASVTADVIAVRARRDGGKFAYRMVDEHESEYRIRPERSDAPLCMFELIRLIENAGPDGPTLPVLRMNRAGGSDWDDLRAFITVSSPFYPELESWYDRYLSLWIEVQRGHRRPQHTRRSAPGQGELFAHDDTKGA